MPVPPIDPKDQGSLKQLDDELQKYIQQAQQGKEDKKTLFKIQQQIKSLASNSKIPNAVRQSLQSALQSLKGDSIGGGLSGAISAKLQIDQAIGFSGTSDEKK